MKHIGMIALTLIAMSVAAAPACADPPATVEGGIEFAFNAPEALEVYLAGEFNGWSSTANLMSKDAEGVWRIVLDIDPGRYEYKFVMDGVWQEDPDNPMSISDPYGGKNSVLVIGDDGEVQLEEAAEPPAPAAPVSIPEGALGPPAVVDDGVLFSFEAPEAREVYVAGEFNGWSPTVDLMAKGADGIWRIVLPLDAGRYEYKFVIDQVWQEDPNNPESVPDPYGGKNSVLTVGGEAKPTPKAKAKPVPAAVTGKEAPGPPAAVKGGILFTFEAPDAREVYAAGDFNNWSPTADLMTKGSDGVWRIVLPIDSGRYEYKFVIDGMWQEDPKNPQTEPDPYGGRNSVLVVGDGGAVIVGEAAEAVAAPKTPIVDRLKGKGKPIYVALLWHQHQPKYMKDPETGEYAEPWVRIHAVKDYYDMVAILKDYPRMRFTVNLTPVLLMQLEEVIEGYDRWQRAGGKYMPGADKWIRLTLTRPENLTREEKAYVLRNFFRMPWGTMLNPYPRFKELASMKAGDSEEQIERTLQKYTDQDFRDLQAWFNLAELDPDFKEGNVRLPTGSRVALKHLIEKGRDFTEADKREIIDAHMEIMKAVVKVHRDFRDNGQIEIITTPFYHPILPLIYDTDLAKVAMPGVPLPQPPLRRPEDASAHLELAQENYGRLFGGSARGLWPAEGSVAEDVVPLIADEGFRWMASDEEVLKASLPGRGFGDREKYQAWWAEKDGKRVAIMFRDRALSDAIGFNYSKMDGVAAANDLLQRLHRIHSSLATTPGTYVVPIFLDGENAWEHYPRDGKDFFHSMYDQISRASWLIPVTIDEFLQEHPPKQTIDELWPGSWIAHNFATWIGEPEENEGWSLLIEARSALEEYRLSAGADEGAVDRAFSEMYAAEGSDWFWWYGKDQSSGNDEFFDEAFRSLLRNVYRAIGREPPGKLWAPIVMPAAIAPSKKVGGFFTPDIDGKVSSGEWAEAGVVLDEEGGAMQRGAGDAVAKISYGYDRDNLYLKVTPGAALEGGHLRVYFSLPKTEDGNVFSRVPTPTGEQRSFGFGLGSELTLPVGRGSSGSMAFSSARGGNRWSAPSDVGRYAVGGEIEMAIPFGALQASSLAPVRFCVVYEGADGLEGDAAPERGGVELVVPEQGDVEVLLSLSDPKGDDHGPGSYTYPTNPAFEPGVFDVESVRVMRDPTGWLIFRLGFAGPITNPWGGRDGYSVQGVDIYLDTDGKRDSGSRDLFENRLARTTPESAWEFFVRVCMDEVAIYKDPQTLLSDSEVLVQADPATSTLSIRIPESVVGRVGKKWKAIIAVVSHEGLFSEGRVRAILPTATEWEFGGGDGKGPNIIDLIVPEGESQEDVLSLYRRTGAFSEIPGIPLRP